MLADGVVLRVEGLDVFLERRCAGHMCSGSVGRISKAVGGLSGRGQGRRAGIWKDQDGGCLVYWLAMDCECHLPQAQRVAKGVPVAVSAAAPMRRKLCQVKADHGEPCRRRAKCTWRCCLEVAKGPPEDVVVVERVERRATQAAVQGPTGLVTHRRAIFSS